LFINGQPSGVISDDFVHFEFGYRLFNSWKAFFAVAKGLGLAGIGRTAKIRHPHREKQYLSQIWIVRIAFRGG